VPSACDAQAGIVALLAQVEAVPPVVAALVAARLKAAACQPYRAPVCARIWRI
jgi:hypothetical protein